MPGAKVFLSYRHNHVESEQIRRDIEAKLIEHGYEVLVDQTIQGGDRWPTKLYEWVLECAAAVVLASSESKASDWCQREWHVLAARAEASGTRVVPVCIGLQPSELGALSGLQAIIAGADVVTQVLSALSDVKSWQVSGNDYLALHQAWNKYQFTKEPVLGREQFSLEDIYQETDCGVMTWGEISPGSAGFRDPFDERQGGRRPLIKAVTDFILQPNFRDAVVVQGPAGAGKSAFTLRLAQALEPSNLRGVRLRFRDMRLATHDSVDEMLADALRVGPESEQPPVPMKDLFDETRLRETVTIGNTTLCRWVFILDGWDEVSLAGSAGYQAQLRTWLPKIREFLKRPGAPIRLVITGRPSVELKESGFLHKDTPVLTIRSIRPDQLDSLACTLAEKGKWGLDPDRCKPMLNSYVEWFEKRESSGVEMLGLPLLALLTFRTVAERVGDIDPLIESPSALYAALIDQTVINSGKGVPESLDGTVQRGGTSLRRLLTRTAAMISIFWSERISFEELRLRLEEEGDLQQWVASATSNNPLHELVVNYYFKGGHADLGCEFLHKSFREYLFAEAIVMAMEEIAGTQVGPLAPPRLAYWKDFEEGTPWYQASRAFAKLLGPTGLTPDIQFHLFWLIDRSISISPARWIFLRDLLADVYGWWAEGVHLRPQPRRERGQHSWDVPYVVEMVKWALPYTKPDAEPPRTASLDANLGYALIQLTAFVHYRLLSAGESSHNWERRYQRHKGRKVLFCPGNGYFMPIAARWQTIFMPFPPSLNLPGADLSGEQLRGAILDGANLVGANLTRASLSKANLSKANLSTAVLFEANLNGAILDGANLVGANLTRASLSKANLSRADLSMAVLLEADLSWANLNRANLTEARLEGASLSEATLRRAVLIGADLGALPDREGGCTFSNLERVDLYRADLRRATLHGANLHESDLTEADLRETDLTAADLRGAFLDRATLSGAKLTGADLTVASTTGTELDMT